MILTDLILAKKGPLAKVWISAHHERKLSKAQALQVDVEETVEAILDQDAEPIALRMSGQLMLGVVRIYSRKVQYLFDDCKDARERIVMAFRPGAVDLPEDQLRASRAAITLQDRNMDFDMILGDLAFNFQKEFRPRGTHVADAADITLPRSRFYAESNRSFSVQPQSDSGQDSQEEGMDLELDMGDETLSLEFARHNDQGSRRSSIASELRMAQRAFSKGSDKASQRSQSRDIAPFELEGSEADGVVRENHAMELDEPIDLGLDMGFGFDFSGGADVNMADGGVTGDDDRQRRESTRLSTPPPLDDLIGDQSSLATITPRTAARISKLVQTRDAHAQADKPPRKKVRVMAVDEEIELQMERGQGQRRDTTAILGKENFVPANEAIIAMMHVREDPQAFFLPTIKRGNETYFVGGLPGMAPQLAELFTFPTNVLRRRSDPANLVEGENDRRKRLRTGVDEDLEDDEELELGRYDGNPALSDRRSRHASKLADGFDGATDTGLDGGMQEDMGMDFDIGGDDTMGDQLPNRDMTADEPSQRSVARAASVAASIAFGDHLDKSDLECPIAIFDSRPVGPSGSLSQSQVSATQSAYLDESASALSRRRSGYSQNTIQAEALLRRELGVTMEEESISQQAEDEEKALSFQKVSEKGSRRAASSFFFELLVLGTRDSIKIKQDTPYDDIIVTAKPNLWHSAATGVAA